MCGIFGHVGGKNSLNECLKGLKLLEYRGYDSAGIAGMHQGQLYCFKEKGNISELEKALEERMLPLKTTIGHTRWATHGSASRENAHPHFDQKKEIALVHNGILENHIALRSMLKQKGIHFESETDTEVIVQLISYFYKNDIIEALQKALPLMKGFWGIVLIHKKHPDQIIATARGNPIVIGLSPTKKEAFVSSDFYAFNRDDLNLYFLQDDEIATVSKKEVIFLDKFSKSLSKSPEYLTLSKSDISKGNYEHFMLKEIFEQPQSMNTAFGKYLNADTSSILFAEISSLELRQIENIIILGCGSSWHAACIGAAQLEKIAKIPASAHIASEFRFNDPILSPKTLVIAISQSGETLDTLAAVRMVKSKGIKVLAICNVPNSLLTRESDATILQHAGPEVSVCSTKGFTSQLTILSLFCLHMNQLRNKNAHPEIIEQFLQLPQIAQRVLDQSAIIAKYAKKYSGFTNFFFLGRQYMYPTSLEAALKLKEISYLNASGYPAGELKHGPLALVDEQSIVIGLMGNDLTFDKMCNNLLEVKARGGILLAFVPENRREEIQEIVSDCIILPVCPDHFASIPYSIALQLFAYGIAKQRNTNIDKPRNLAKSVTVE